MKGLLGIALLLGVGQGGLLRSVGHGDRDQADDLIHWATGAWRDWERQPEVVRGDTNSSDGGSNETLAELHGKLAALHAAQPGAGLLATLEIEGMAARKNSAASLLNS